MICVRPPLPSEAPLVAELILLSDCGLLTALFGPQVRGLLSFLQDRRSNPYSARKTLVVEEDGAVRAAAVGALGVQLRTERLQTARALFAWYRLAFAARLPRLVRAGGAANVADSDFYLSNIALFPAARRRGLGRELVRAVEARAWSLDARRIVLDVERGNEGARAFYEHLGYREEREIEIALGGAYDYRFRRMAKGRPG